MASPVKEGFWCKPRSWQLIGLLECYNIGLCECREGVNLDENYNPQQFIDLINAPPSCGYLCCITIFQMHSPPPTPPALKIDTRNYYLKNIHRKLKYWQPYTDTVDMRNRTHQRPLRDVMQAAHIRSWTPRPSNEQWEWEGDLRWEQIRINMIKKLENKKRKGG